MAALLPLFALASVALALPSSEAPSVDSIFKRGQNRFNGTKIGSNGDLRLLFSVSLVNPSLKAISSP